MRPPTVWQAHDRPCPVPVVNASMTSSCSRRLRKIPVHISSATWLRESLTSRNGRAGRVTPTPRSARRQNPQLHSLKDRMSCTEHDADCDASRDTVDLTVGGTNPSRFDDGDAEVLCHLMLLLQSQIPSADPKSADQHDNKHLQLSVTHSPAIIVSAN